MCLIFLGFQSHSQFPLVVAANRDEFFARDTRQAHRWEDGTLAGRDGRAGGTWLGLRPSGRGYRFAAITNRRAASAPAQARSRGELTTQFLAGSQSAEAYAKAVQSRAGDYAGFNLLLCDGDRLFYVGSELSNALELAPGIYGLSNGSLDEPWPKLRTGKSRFSDLLQSSASPTTDSLIALMDERTPAADSQLPSTGIPKDLERRLSSAFIVNEPEHELLADYGTLCSTAVLVDSEGALRFHERNFDRQGQASRSHYFSNTSYSLNTSRSACVPTKTLCRR